MNKRVLSASAFLALVCIGCTPPPPPPPPPPPASCSLNIPLPPDPLPAGFDWTPLAKSWCSQLAACGYPTQGCVQHYLDVINNPPAAAGGGGADTRTETSTERGVCEDSVEAQANPSICNVERKQSQSRPIR
jgi:hypothetical protein